MTPAVHITPRHDAVDTALGEVGIAAVDLGGIPRGAVLVMTVGADFEHDAAAVLNGLAVHGYESIAADMTAIDGTDDALVQVVTTLVEHVGKRGWQHEQVGVIGYAGGGRLALLASSQLRIGAAVSVSPSGLCTSDGHLSTEIIDLAATVRTPWLGMWGENDPTMPARAFGELKRLLNLHTPVYTQVVYYRGVADDFYRRSTEALEIAASYDYWQRTIEWLDQRVVPRPTPLATTWRHRQAVR